MNADIPSNGAMLITGVLGMFLVIFLIYKSIEKEKDIPSGAKVCLFSLCKTKK